MRDLPILYSAPMVRAQLKDRKTQTRRTMPDQSIFRDGISDPEIWTGFMGWQSIEWALENRGACGKGVLPRIAVGDRLYVREAWRTLHVWDCLAPRHLAEDSSKITFEADPENRNPLWSFGKFRQAMHMPRWASRITNIVEAVRIERLQSITERDALAEGIIDENIIVDTHCAGGHHTEVTADRYWNGTEPDDFEGHDNAVDAYLELWDRINGAGASDQNPWVVAYTFRVIKQNIDQIEGRP